MKIIKKLLFIVIFLAALPRICIALESDSLHKANHVQNMQEDHVNEKKEQFELLQPAPKKMISITIDDLPFVGEYRNFHLNMMIETMTKEEVPATGFIIASEVRKNNWEILRKFRDAGFGLGNHTLNHANLNKMETKEYIREIQKADNILLPVLTEPKYFRYPYLAMSSGKKKEDILCYLAQKNYQVAPITIDSKDFVFNQRLLSVSEINRRTYLEELKPFYLDFIWQQTLRAEEHNQFHHNNAQAQILLIHANLLNAYVLPDIIHLYKQKGYEFVSLENALKTFKFPTQCARTQVLARIQTKQQQHISSDKNIKTFVEWD
ncbi:polysaccharide deacetylase [Legionella longbeachae]|uniref:Putative peptidoglycan GlcNAc deacetylase proteins n=2 Tax=Legionella longbeachae TaxID=450 RepID=D3HKN2_LEGLN|nr:polysaccharide deacetylase [Legionella longbeachae]EEZ93873.1 polysaccharide deacetylase domain-containing protein [Legionella longbeachae D-4968]CBJ12998.1 putative peptidoglycan GlcNAc deacetylase proteins [Legionella longbeachae NSW150]VEE03514.1 peptidoglycan GlcNAc deacetylases [Legionella oakridgensis]HBD7397791.1 polysaccharide deacetylase family protein [Legionella pneumophila]